MHNHCRHQIMLECWSGNPKMRPKFLSLRKQFDSILSAQHTNVYIDLQTNESNLIYACKDDAESSADSAFTSKRASFSLEAKATNGNSLSPSSSSIYSRKSDCYRVIIMVTIMGKLL